MKNKREYIGLLCFIVFCISSDVLAAKKFNAHPIISEKAVFIPLDDVFISKVSHNGNIVVGDIKVLPMIYRLFIPYNKQVRYAKYVPFTFSISNKKLETWESLSKNNDIVARAISDNEIFVGNKNSSAFRWTKQTGIIKLPYSIPLDVNMRQAMVKAGCPNDIIKNSAEAADISSDGKVIVGWCNDKAFLWSEKTGMIGLGCLYGAKFCDSRANAVSADGKTVVGVSASPQYGCEAFRWTKSEGVTSLGVLYSQEERFGSEATGVSADGSIIVGRSNSKSDSDKTDNIRAFYWTKATGMIGLEDIDGFYSTPSTVSDDGQIIVGRSHKKNCKTPDEHGLPEAFIWTSEKGIRNFKNVLINDYNLPIENWSLNDAKAISGDGTVIVGNGRNPQGRDTGWIVKFKKN